MSEPPTGFGAHLRVPKVASERPLFEQHFSYSFIQHLRLTCSLKMSLSPTSAASDLASPAASLPLPATSPSPKHSSPGLFRQCLARTTPDMLQSSSTIATTGVTTSSPLPAFPPPSATAPTSRRSYQRDSSASPAPMSLGNGARRFSSSSRGRATFRSSLSLERSSSSAGGRSSSSVDWVDSDRSQSGSRAPLWRKKGGEVRARAASPSPEMGAGRSRKHRLSTVPPLLAHFLGYRPSS